MSQTEFFRNRMIEHDRAIKKNREPLQKIIGKKRQYSEAMGKDNDYEVVQERNSHQTLRGDNWIYSYMEEKS